MPDNFGKLILTLPGGQRQEYSLAKATIAIGRSNTCDIVVGDQNVSRNHTRVECGPEGCVAVDLGSINGTRVNGARVERHTLAPGDTIAIGKSTLRFDGGASDPDVEMTRIQTIEDVETSLLDTPLEMELRETGTPRLAICTASQTTELDLTGDAVTIGRSPENDIVIDSPKASRRHARIERKGGSFVLSDLGSNNGTRVGGQPVTQHTLRPGDTIYIGDSRIVFKGGFESEELTVVDVPDAGRKRRPVVIVPGFMGSALWKGSEQVWPKIKYMLTNPEMYRWPDKDGVEPRGLVSEVVIIPNVIKLEQYSRLVEYLEEGLGYERGNDLIEFGYDFRDDVRENARKLGAVIENWNVKAPVTIIAHSMGCMVTRYYADHLGGHKKVGRIVLMGGPHTGTPKAMEIVTVGPGALPFGLLDGRMRNVLASYPSVYQILPTYLCATDQHGCKFNLLEDDTWLAEPFRPLLRYGREFRRELGASSRVPSISIFGYGLKTVAGFKVERNSNGYCTKVEPVIDPYGDSVIPESSAVMESAEIHPVRQYHGVLYVDNDVKMRLKLELTK